MSLSLGAKSIPRLCCHQTGSLEMKDHGSITDLSHLEGIREEMKSGKVPSLCHGCFQLEKENCSSPRQDYIERFGNQNQDVKIRYLDVTFNNDCNLECIMCSPLYSYKLNKLYHKGLDLKHSPVWYTELSSELLQNILPSLEVVTLTGGEPFVSKKILDFIALLAESEYGPKITLRVFTNLTQISESLISLLKKFKKVELLLSIDSVNENYEFIRYPASWKKLTGNIELLNKNRFPHLDVHLHAMLMCTNWNYIGDLITFYRMNLAQPNFLPIFVEIDTPSFLHPGVLPQDQFEEGLNKIEAVLSKIEVNEPLASEEIKAFRQLLNKVSHKRNTNQLIQYKVFISKIVKLRKVENE